jgi:hypothetical protein
MLSTRSEYKSGRDGPLLARAPVEELIFSMEVDTDDRDEDEAAERSYAYLAAWLEKNGHR